MSGLGRVQSFKSFGGITSIPGASLTGFTQFAIPFGSASGGLTENPSRLLFVNPSANFILLGSLLVSREDQPLDNTDSPPIVDLQGGRGGPSSDSNPAGAGSDIYWVTGLGGISSGTGDGGRGGQIAIGAQGGGESVDGVGGAGGDVAFFTGPGAESSGSGNSGSGGFYSVTTGAGAAKPLGSTVGSAGNAGSILYQTGVGGSGSLPALPGGAGGNASWILGQGGDGIEGGAGGSWSMELGNGGDGTDNFGGDGGDYTSTSGNGGTSVDSDGGDGGRYFLTSGEGGGSINGSAGNGGEFRLIAQQGAQSVAGSGGDGGGFVTRSGDGGSSSGANGGDSGEYTVESGNAGGVLAGSGIAGNGSAIRFTGGQGGSHIGDDGGFAGSGSSIEFLAGRGGDTSHSGTGGFAGLITFTGQSGGDSDSGQAGQGTVIDFTAGSGGNSPSGDGGDGGNIRMISGDGGTGGNSNGDIGQIYLNYLNNLKSVIIGTLTPISVAKLYVQGADNTIDGSNLVDAIRVIGGVGFDADTTFGSNGGGGIFTGGNGGNSSNSFAPGNGGGWSMEGGQGGVADPSSTSNGGEGGGVALTGGPGGRCENDIGDGGTGSSTSFGSGDGGEKMDGTANGNGGNAGAVAINLGVGGYCGSGSGDGGTAGAYICFGSAGGESINGVGGRGSDIYMSSGDGGLGGSGDGPVGHIFLNPFNIDRGVAIGTFTDPDVQLVIAQTGIIAYGVRIQNTSTLSAAHARLNIQTSGSTGGDPFTLYTVPGVTQLSTGIDNSDSDKYKIVFGANPSAATAAISVSSASFVGIGTNTAEGELTVNSSASPSLRLKISDSTTSFFNIEHASVSQTTIINRNNSGTSLIDLSPEDTAGSNACQFRIFRSTATSGEASIIILRGDGSSTTAARIAANTAAVSTSFNFNSEDIDFNVNGDGVTSLLFVNAGTDRVGIGTNSPITRFANTSTAVNDGSAVGANSTGITLSDSGTAYVISIGNTSSSAGADVMNLRVTATTSATNILNLCYAGTDRWTWRADSTLLIDTDVGTSALTAITHTLDHASGSFGVQIIGYSVDITSNANAAPQHGVLVENTSTGGSGAIGNGVSAFINGSTSGNAISGSCSAGSMSAGAGVFGSANNTVTFVSYPAGRWGIVGDGQNLLYNATDESRVLRIAVGGTTAMRQDYYGGTVTTTNSTVTTIFTFATASNTVYHIRGEVVARRTGGSSGTANDMATYSFVVSAKNNAGTLTLPSNVVTTVYEDQAGWNFTFTTSGTSVLAQVTGATNNNITWHAIFRILECTS